MFREHIVLQINARLHLAELALMRLSSPEMSTLASLIGATTSDASDPRCPGLTCAGLAEIEGSEEAGEKCLMVPTIADKARIVAARLGRSAAKAAQRAAYDAMQVDQSSGGGDI
jgi:hypothetical protein